MSSYKLNPGKKEMYSDDRRFARSELQEMSTYKLKEICRRYKIVNAYKHSHEKQDLIDLVLKHRGIKKSKLITGKKEDGLNKLQEVVDEDLVTELTPANNIKVPAKIIIYDEVGISKKDKYKVIAKNEIEESNVLLISENNYLCGVFRLEEAKNQENVYYLTANKEHLRIEEVKNKNYSLLFFPKDDSNYIYKNYYADEKLPPRNLKYYKLAVGDLKVRQVEETNTVLCIDFGTSNTTAGAYLDTSYVSNIPANEFAHQDINTNQINFVKFPYVTSRKKDWRRVIPTIVYVEDCEDPDNIKFLFGHEAKYKMKKNDYISNASVFQGIKRWVNTYRREEEIYDSRGNIAQVARGKIISAYINYIINTAQQQFKCRFKNIHISSPVKFKAQFLSMFEQILPEYKLETEKVLDEGISVLYNTIADQIEKQKFYDGEEHKALVIDCGGGTTDLSSCKFKIKEGEISYKIDIKTGFENGDTGFGGNNITYRIMQFMKIIFSYYYQYDGETVDIDDLVSVPNVDLFRYVDRNGVEDVYSRLEEYYQQAEDIIPTRYKEYENKTSDEYQKVKNNFYFLWEIAENMKKEFFKRTNILRNKFASMDLEQEDDNLHVTPLNKWSLSLYREGELETVNQFPEVVFNIKEISKLIKADIYEIIRKFIEDLYQTGELMEYSIIKLTGQSCKIDIFREALKEFVPGKKIEFKRRGPGEDNSVELKLSCLRGVIKYMKSKKIGDIEVSIENDPPVIPYSVTAFTFRGEEKVIIKNKQKIHQVFGSISKPLSTREIKFYLKNEEDKIKKEYIYENNFGDYKEIAAEEIIEEYNGKITQEETDTINNGEAKFFLFTQKESWGFFVLPIGRYDDQLYAGEERFFPFEGELANLDFFDGLK